MTFDITFDFFSPRLNNIAAVFLFKLWEEIKQVFHFKIRVIRCGLYARHGTETYVDNKRKEI